VIWGSARARTVRAEMVDLPLELGDTLLEVVLLVNLGFDEGLELGNLPFELADGQRIASRAWRRVESPPLTSLIV
jgi:hypothetical protein